MLHAGASMASVILKIQPHQIDLTIEDDGCGFDYKNESYWVSQGILVLSVYENGPKCWAPVTTLIPHLTLVQKFQLLCPEQEIYDEESSISAMRKQRLKCCRPSTLFIGSCPS